MAKAILKNVEDNTKVPKKQASLTKKDIFVAVGRRKTAIARVKIISGTGKISINDEEIANPSRVYTEPLKIANLIDKVDSFIKVGGGGLSGQAEAIRLGFARAIIKMNPELRKTLKIEGFLTRDPRMKERKKPGLKGARRAPQWQKR